MTNTDMCITDEKWENFEYNGAIVVITLIKQIYKLSHSI